jgi:outer membrane protein assembly factor BamD
MMKFSFRFIPTLLFSAVLLLSSGCGRNGVKLNELSPEEQFAQTKRLFDKKDYYKAKMQFTVLVLNHPGSGVMEEAQFYLSECHFHLKEYLLAISEYEKLIKSLPQSGFVDDSRQKMGLCYEKLSPSYGLDQDYTLKAINEYQQFLDDYPQSELRPVVESHMNLCREKLAKKEYMTGELYRKMGYDSSAVISFDAVLENYQDTSFSDDALFWKAQCLMKLNKTDEGMETFRLLISSFPDSPGAEKAKNRLKEVMERRK